MKFREDARSYNNDSTGCKGERQPHKCRARLAWSIRAGAMAAPGEIARPVTAAA